MGCRRSAGSDRVGGIVYHNQAKGLLTERVYGRVQTPKGVIPTPGE